MKTLKYLFLLFIALTLSLSLISCGSEDEAEDAVPTDVKTLNVYNWGEYISDGSFDSLDTNAAFEEYFNENLASKYGFKIEVIYSTYATNEDMYSKITSGAGTYDVIIPSDYMIEKLKKENWLYEFDVTELENFGNIREEFTGLYYDEFNRYSVPYTYGMMGVIYNTQLVDEEDYEKKSWDLLWNPKYKGKILQFNNPRDAFGSAMYLEGIYINSEESSDWDLALKKLQEQKPLLQGYVNDEIFNKMTTASAAIAPYFAGDFLIMADQNEDLDFYYPDEGTNYFVDAMCIPKNAKLPEVAKEYINFMLSEEVAVANAVYIGYASPNKLVYDGENFNEEYADEMGEYALEILYSMSPDEVNAKYLKKFDTACYKSFSAETQAYVNMLWESLKTENSTELWVHVSSAAIVVAVLALAVYTTYTKKKRSRDYRLRDKAARKAKMAQKSK